MLWISPDVNVVLMRSNNSDPQHFDGVSFLYPLQNGKNKCKEWIKDQNSYTLL